jgi:arginyl-tRNA synthetase
MLRELRDRLASELSAILSQWDDEVDVTTTAITINVDEWKTNGLVATPIAYRLASNYDGSPVAIADELAATFRERGRVEEIARVETVDGYVNFYVDEDTFTTQILDHILDAASEYGVTNEPTTRAVWDFASPNIGKPLHIGHLRNAVLGDTLGNILETQGYDLIRINWLGDWGVQFGHLLHQFEKTKGKRDDTDDLLGFLAKQYQRASRPTDDRDNEERTEESEHVRTAGHEYFARLETGDTKLRELWDWILTESEEQLRSMYDQIGVTFDIWTTESARVLDQHTDHLLETIQDQNLAVETANGAYIIPGDDLATDGSDQRNRDDPREYTDFVLLKSDGTTTYEMRDLASLVYRVNTLDFDAMFYLVGEDHRNHFRKLFTVTRKLGYTERSFTYLDYGPIALSNGSMSTREGRFISVTELFDRVYERAATRVRTNNPALDEERIDEIAEGITVGTIRFDTMFHRRTTEMTFDVEEAVSLTGDTAPYIQYAAVRGLNILHKVSTIPDPTAVYDQPFNEFDYRLAIRLAQYPLVLERCKDRYDPTPLAQYLIDLARTFHRFYHENRVLDADQSRERRLALVAATIQVFENAFETAGIPLLRQM